MGMGAHTNWCPKCKDYFEFGHICPPADPEQNKHVDPEQEKHDIIEKVWVDSLSSDEVMRCLLSRAYQAAASKITELTPKKKDNNVRIRLENTLHRLYTRWSKQCGYPERK